MDFVDFNDIPLDIDPAALEELIQSRIAARDVRIDPPVPDFNTLTDEHQKAAVRTEDDCIRVIGGPGTGKTQTLVNRILGRLSAGVRPERILMLTFDSASAIVIREQIVAATAQPGKPLPPVTVTTLNAYGYSLLRERFPAEYRPLASAAVCNRIARGLLTQFRAQHPAAATLLPRLKSSFYVGLMSLIKNAGFDPRGFNAADLSRYLGTPSATAVFFPPRQLAIHNREIVHALAWMFQNYDALLGRAGNMDFDDQKLRALACLKAAADVLDSVRSSLDEVIVDDFQDVSPLDFALISALSRKGRLVVAGDDDQAIHASRGCTPDFLIDLEEHCGRTATAIELTENHRSPADLAVHAARLISCNARRIPKKPVTVRAHAGLTMLSSANAALEAKALATCIEDIRREVPDLAYGDMVVLYGSSAQILPLQVELILKDIPYQIRTQDSIVESGDLTKLLSIVRLKLQSREEASCDPVDAWNCIRSFYRLPPDLEERVFNLCIGQESFERIARHPEMASCLTNMDLRAFHAAWESILAARTLTDVLDMVAAKFKGLGAMAGTLEEVMENDVPLGEIFSMAAAYDRRPADFVKDIGEALAKAGTASFGRHQDGIPLLVYHRAKGRQWHTVMIAGANEGIIPREKAAVEDERRLFYVGMTRASSNLVISTVRNVCRTPVAISRFLSEAGLDRD